MLDQVGERYAVAIPPTLLALITHPNDPVGRQFIPHADELLTAPHELADPIGDDALSPVPGIVHRYADRALLKPLLVCPVYCRFCFRREHVGPGGGLLTDPQLAAALDWLRAHPAITEVILTGGDPLLLSPRRLRAILDALEAMPHVQTLRIHSRVPVADPAPGTARFHVPVAEGRALLETLRGRVTGLAWPTYVLDIPGGHGKVPIGPDYLDGDVVRDPAGHAHALAAADAPG